MTPAFMFATGIENSDPTFFQRHYAERTSSIAYGPAST
jgi:hypothetical protein